MEQCVAASAEHILYVHNRGQRWTCAVEQPSNLGGVKVKWGVDFIARCRDHTSDTCLGADLVLAAVKCLEQRGAEHLVV